MSNPPPHRATVHRLRPRNRRQIEALQSALNLGGWSEPTKIELNDRLSQRLPEPGTLWSFVMSTANAEAIAAFLGAIVDGPRGFATLRVFNALPPYVRRDTGELL